MRGCGMMIRSHWTRIPPFRERIYRSLLLNPISLCFALDYTDFKKVNLRQGSVKKMSHCAFCEKPANISYATRGDGAGVPSNSYWTCSRCGCWLCGPMGNTWPEFCGIVWGASKDWKFGHYEDQAFRLCPLCLDEGIDPKEFQPWLDEVATRLGLIVGVYIPGHTVDQPCCDCMTPIPRPQHIDRIPRGCVSCGGVVCGDCLPQAREVPTTQTSPEYICRRCAEHRDHCSLICPDCGNTHYPEYRQLCRDEIHPLTPDFFRDWTCHFCGKEGCPDCRKRATLKEDGQVNYCTNCRPVFQKRVVDQSVSRIVFSSGEDEKSSGQGFQKFLDWLRSLFSK